MAVRKPTRTRKRQQEEPENKYGGGGPSGGQAPGTTSAERGEQQGGSRKRNQPLAPTEGYYAEGTYGHRADPKFTNPTYLQYLPTRPGYLKYFAEDVSAPLIAGRGNPGLIAELQRQLAGAGLITGKVPRGVWDPKTEKAYQRLLEIANVWGTSDKETLNRLLSESEGAIVEEGGAQVGRRTSTSGEGGRGTGFRVDENGNFVPEGPESFVPPPLELRLPAPEDVGRVVRRASIDLLGQGLNQSDIDTITQSYMSTVTSRQRQAYNQMVERERQLFETGTTNIGEITTVEAPSAETFAETELERTRGPEVQKNKGMELLLGLVNQWS